MRRRGFMSLLKSVFLVQLFVIIILIGVTGNYQRVTLPAIRTSTVDYLDPFSRIVIGEKMAMNMFRDSSFLPGEANLLYLDPEYLDEVFSETLLTASIQALAYTSPDEEDFSVIEVEDVSAADTEDVSEPIPDPVAAARPNKGKIMLYCTHSAESYIPDGVKARVDGKRGLINQVAQHLNDELRKDGFNSEFINTIHDADYLISYSKSRNTIKNYLANNKSVEAIFDVHRDSIPGATSGETVTINGKKCAPILIIVGTNERKPHPEWKKNLAFAHAIQQAAEAKYPGLVKDVRTKAGTYNQEFHPQALLLEIGYDHNTLAEAQYAATLFSDVLAEVL